MHVRLLLAGALVAALASPMAASAADADVALPPAFAAGLKTCYVSVSETQREPVEIHAINFMPFSPMDIFIDDVAQTVPPNTPEPTADALGALDGATAAPYVETGQRLFTLRVAERRNPAAAIAAVSKVTALSVTQSPGVSRSTSSRVRFRGRGFTDRTLPVYAHYLYRGKHQRTVTVAKPYGDCGLFSVKRKQFPMAHPRTGAWFVQFDQQAVYSPQATSPFTQIKITVTKRIKKPKG